MQSELTKLTDRWRGTILSTRTVTHPYPTLPQRRPKHPPSPLPAGVSNVQHDASAMTLSTPVKPHHEKNKTPNTPTSDEMDLAQWCDDFGANATGEDECRDENNEDISSSSMSRLSPIQHGVNLDSTMLAAAASSSALSSSSFGETSSPSLRIRPDALNSVNNESHPLYGSGLDRRVGLYP